MNRPSHLLVAKLYYCSSSSIPSSFLVVLAILTTGSILGEAIFITLSCSVFLTISTVSIRLATDWLLINFCWYNLVHSDSICSELKAGLSFITFNLMLLFNSESSSIFLVGRRELVDCDLFSFSDFSAFISDLYSLAWDISSAERLI